MEKDVIHIPEIVLEWSKWTSWLELLIDARSGEGIRIPSTPGVYEVRIVGSSECLTVGKASDLRMRVRQGLVKGKVPHSTGENIRAYEDVTHIEVRWAETDRPAAAEEELHRRCIGQFGRLPQYTQRT